MTGIFDFSLEEDFAENAERLKAHLSSIDPQCAEILFDHIAILRGEDSNARRDFNQKVLEALEAAAQTELDGQGGQ